MKTKLAIIAILSITVIFASCTTAPQAEPTIDYSLCTVENVNRSVSEIEPILNAFVFSDEVAGSTSRGNLPTQLVYMQELRMQIDALQYPDCLSLAEADLLKSFEETILAYTAFMMEKENVEINDHFSKAANYLALYNNDVSSALSAAAEE